MYYNRDEHPEWVSNLTKYCIDNPLSEEEKKMNCCWGQQPSWNTGKAGTYTYECLQKTYTIQRPDGVVETITGLSVYCREHNINIGHLHSTLTGHRRHTKGYRIIPQTEVEVKGHSDVRAQKKMGKRRPGQQNGRAILNEKQVRQIRQHHKEKQLKVREIADLYKVKKSTIEAIIYNRIWVDIC